MKDTPHPHHVEMKRADLLVRGRVVARDDTSLFVSDGFFINGMLVGRLIDVGHGDDAKFSAAMPLPMAAKFMPLQMLAKPDPSLDILVAGRPSRFPQQKIDRFEGFTFEDDYKLLLALRKEAQTKPDAATLAKTAGT